jgi:hypothetical protein
MPRGGSWSKLSRKAKVRRSAGAWAAGLINDPGSGPEGSIAHADFATGTFDGDGFTELSDFLTENAAWAGFDTAYVQAGIGLYDEDSEGFANPILGTELTAELLASGFSAVWTYNVILENTPRNINLEVLDLPDYNHEWIFGFYGADGGASFYDGVTDENVAIGQGLGVHKAGMSVDPATGAVILVVDGIEVINTTAVAATPNAIAMQCTGGVALQVATFYPSPIKTSAELQALTA